ncbi:uncharacterized protein LOC144343488 [Saccoglossus kowalevskii]
MIRRMLRLLMVFIAASCVVAVPMRIFSMESPLRPSNKLQDAMDRLSQGHRIDASISNGDPAITQMVRLYKSLQSWQQSMHDADIKQALSAILDAPHSSSDDSIDQITRMYYDNLSKLQSYHDAMSDLRMWVEKKNALEMQNSNDPSAQEELDTIETEIKKYQQKADMYKERIINGTYG